MLLWLMTFKICVALVYLSEKLWNSVVSTARLTQLICLTHLYKIL
jgi:hypothetical protein